MNPRIQNSTKLLTTLRTDTATVYVDGDFNILKLTPDIGRFINILASDIGRPIGHFTLNFQQYTFLVEDIEKVLKSGQAVRKKLQLKGTDEWFELHIKANRSDMPFGKGAAIRIKPIKKPISPITVEQPKNLTDILLETLPDYIFYLSKDAEYVEFLFPKDASPATNPEIYIGKKITDCLAEGEQKRFMHHLGTVLRTGIEQTFEYQTKHEDARIFECRMIQVDDEHALCISRDCTERVMAEKAMMQSEYLYRKIATYFPDGLVVAFNKKLEIISYEGQLGRYFTTNPDALIGKQPFFIKGEHQQFWWHFKDLYAEVVNGKDYRFEAPYRDLTLLFQLMPLKNEEGEIFGGMCLIQDVTKIKATEVKLQAQVEEIMLKNKELKKYIESNLELESFAYVTSHDLKQPLRNIISFAQLLELRYKKQLDDNAKEYIKYIVDNAKSMNAFIEELMNYSRLSSSKEKAFEAVNVEYTLLAIEQNLAQQIKENGVQLVYKNLPSEINVIKVKFVQLLQNLISNAIKFRKAEETPIIQISVEEQKDQWLFQLTDNGIGIEQEYVEKVFQLFKKLHTKTQYEGSGIGLATCKKIVDQHNGRIWVTSKLGVGSTFSFTIAKNLGSEEEDGYGWKG